jgi:molybdate transport system permease protein
MTGDRAFLLAFGTLGGLYVGLLAALVLSDLAATTPAHFAAAFADPAIRSAVMLRLLTSLAAAILSTWVAVPLGYLLARVRFPGKPIVEVLLDVPLVLPPLVLGLSLLVLFRTPPGQAVERYLPFTYAPAGVVLAQFVAVTAFAVRAVRTTFDHLSPRTEQVALTLGCSRWQAFARVALPEAWRGVVVAFTLAWARAVGEFGPVLVFAGVTRHRTEVLATSVFLELSVGKLESAVAVSLVMVAAAAVVTVLARRATA